MLIQCPKCTQRLQVPELKPGQSIRCPKCGQTLGIPAATPPSAPAPAPAQPAAAAPDVSAPAPTPPPPSPAVVAPPNPAPSPPKPAPTPVHEQFVELEEVSDPPALPTPAPSDTFPGLEDSSMTHDPMGLGRVVKEYVARKWWIGLIVFAVLTFLCIPFTIFAALAERKVFIALAVIPQTLFVLGAFICGLLTLLSIKRRVIVHERGLIMHSLFRSAEVRWEEITGVYLSKTGLFVPRDILLDLKDRPQLDLPSAVKNNDELGDRIVAAVAPRLKAEITKALDRGETVAFGPFISVGPKGLEFRPDGAKGKTLKVRWHMIESFVMGRYVTNPGAAGLAAAASIQAQFRVVSKDQPVWICSTGNVANFALFVDILELRFGVKISHG